MRINLGRNFSSNEVINPGIVSFLNFASFKTLKESTETTNNVKFYCDGMLLALLFSLLTLKKVKRFSFDFTSVADPVFRRCTELGKSVYFIGGTEQQSVIFTDKIKELHPDLSIAGFSSGYFDDWDAKANEILAKRPSVVLVSMGAGYQEKMANLLLAKCPTIKVFTSGGFIRQISQSSNPNYYPNLVNRLKLRAFYRMYREPHTIERYLIDYPISIFTILRDFFSGQLIIEGYSI
ncbi:WecB/TagA/CpsF family glycosyltransferase [Vibrio navarrensis]